MLGSFESGNMSFENSDRSAEWLTCFNLLVSDDMATTLKIIALVPYAVQPVLPNVSAKSAAGNS